MEEHQAINLMMWAGNTFNQKNNKETNKNTIVVKCC